VEQKVPHWQALFAAWEMPITEMCAVNEKALNRICRASFDLDSPCNHHCAPIAIYAKKTKDMEFATGGHFSLDDDGWMSFHP
jgi:hypothetical protein